MAQNNTMQEETTQLKQNFWKKMIIPYKQFSGFLVSKSLFTGTFDIKSAVTKMLYKNQMNNHEQEQIKSMKMIIYYVS